MVWPLSLLIAPRHEVPVNTRLNRRMRLPEPQYYKYLVSRLPVVFNYGTPIALASHGVMSREQRFRGDDCY